MSRIIRIFAAAVALLLTASAGAEGMYFGSVPEDEVYIVQSRAHTCTLVAATMMLRNYACQDGSFYEHVTDSAVGQFAWTNQYGLAQHFSVGQVTVSCTPEIQRVPDKKAYLIMCLKEHREGVVIYDTGAPHAIWLFGYDEDTDTFFCADTIKSRGGHAIPLAESIIRGETQEDKIATIDKIWYIV